MTEKNTAITEAPAKADQTAQATGSGQTEPKEAFSLIAGGEDAADLKDKSCLRKAADKEAGAAARREKKAKEKEEKKNMPAGARIFDIIFTVFIYLVSAAILLGAILFSFSTSPDKALFGYRYYNVLTPSMTPTYHAGDLVFVKLSDASEINVGDVITFNPGVSGESYVTHRVVEKLENYKGAGKTAFRTKGDASKDSDPYLTSEERVIGKVTFHIPWLGRVIAFVQVNWLFIILIVIMIAVFFQLLKRYFLMGKDDKDDSQQNKDLSPSSKQEKNPVAETSVSDKSTDVTPPEAP